MAKLNFQHHYFSLQCHTILQKSFEYDGLLAKKHCLQKNIFLTCLKLIKSDSKLILQE